MYMIQTDFGRDGRESANLSGKRYCCERGIEWDIGRGGLCLAQLLDLISCCLLDPAQGHIPDQPLPSSSSSSLVPFVPPLPLFPQQVVAEALMVSLNLSQF
jgi:hypothetical protein